MSRPHPAGWVSLQGQYAGAASRFLAYAIDLVVSIAVALLAVAGISFVVETITRHSIAFTAGSGAVATAMFVLWEFFYFGYSWAASGKTFGMAVLGIRVVQADGTGAGAWRGTVRALVFPFSFLFLGLGFVGILVQHKHQALHDLITGTAVIYAWDARAARLRLLARETDTGPAPTAEQAAEAADGPGLG